MVRAPVAGFSKVMLFDLPRCSKPALSYGRSNRFIKRGLVDSSLFDCPNAPRNCVRAEDGTGGQGFRGLEFI
jgi:hypothetical protein